MATGPYLVMAIPLLIEGGSPDRVDRAYWWSTYG